VDGTRIALDARTDGNNQRPALMKGLLVLSTEIMATPAISGV
jgi:hypothetical protein